MILISPRLKRRTQISTLLAAVLFVGIATSGLQAQLVWRGNDATNPTLWDIGVTSNWVNGASPTVFVNPNTVTFDDTAVGTTVDIPVAVGPGSVTINSSLDFTFTGAGGISGGGGISKSGSGRASVQTANTFTGTTTISGGILHVGTGGLGDTGGQTIANGGGLDFTGADITGETVQIQGAGSDGRGAMFTAGLDSLGGGTRQATSVTQNGDATIGAYYDGADDEFSQNDYRWDLEPGDFPFDIPTWTGNGHDLTKKGRGTVSIQATGDMNVGALNIEEGILFMQGDTTSSGSTVTIGNGTALRQDFTGNATLAFFYSGTTGPAPTGDSHNMNIVLNGGALNGGGATVPRLTIAGTVVNNNVSGDATIDNSIGTAGGQTLVIPQAITGAGDLRIGGGGVLELQSNNTYTGITEVQGSVALVGSGALSATPSIAVANGTEVSPISIDATGRTDGTLALNNQSLTLGAFNSVAGNVTVSSGSSLAAGSGAGTDSTGNSAAFVTGNVVVESGGTLQVNTGKGAEGGTLNVYGQNASTIGAANARFIAFEAEDYSGYVEAGDVVNWDVAAAVDSNAAAALGGSALVATNGTSANPGQDVNNYNGNTDLAQYSMTFSEPGEYIWYVRAAAPNGGQGDSFFGPDKNADTANPNVKPGPGGQSGLSRFGISDEIKDAEDVSRISTDWDWVRAELNSGTGSAQANFEKIVVTQADVDSGQVFTLEFAPRQTQVNQAGVDGTGVILDKMVLAATPLFTDLTDADLDGVAVNTSTPFNAPAPTLTFEVDGDLTLNSGSNLLIDIRGNDDFDNLNVTGTAAVNGTLAVSLDGYTPAVNDTFTIMTAGTLTDAGLALGGPAGSGFTMSSAGNAVTLTFIGGLGLACDFDADGDCDFTDIDTLYGTNPTPAQVNDWLTQASDPTNAYKANASDVYVLGDVDLDGDVDSTDLGLVLNNFGSNAGVGFGGGDLDADTNVNSTDLGLLLNNFGATSPAAAAVPEPNSLVLLPLALTGLLLATRRKR